MRKFLSWILFIAFATFAFFNFDKIINYGASFLEEKKELVIFPGNEYTKNNDYSFVKRSKDYVPYSYQDMLDIIYSILNNGWESFTFYCPSEYVTCISDIKKITENETLLSHINNYVHPYNSFTNLKTTYDDSGEITIDVTKLYSDNDIKEINNKVNQIFKEVINNEMSDEDKIMAIHNYIINNTVYDAERNESGYSKYNSNIAYGTLLEGHSICGGYSDAMAIFLSKMGIDNFKVASKKHVWNAVKLNDDWLHLDLTWDDPISSDGKDNLFHTYFLITTNELFSIDSGSEDIINHTYDEIIYSELKSV